jgi:hypothetical protein
MIDRLISKRVVFIAAVAIVSAVAVAYTFTSAVAFSAFAASLLKVAIILLLFEGLDRYLLEGVDTIKELKQGNAAVAITLLAIALLLAPAIATGQPCPRPAVVDTAMQEVGEKEAEGPNEGPAIRRYMAAVNLSDGYPWCAGFIRWALDRAGASYPDVRSAVATEYITDRSIEARKVLRGAKKVPAGSLNIHRRGDTWKGHIEILTRRWRGKCGTTIGGNTSPGKTGSQRDGDGVWPRKRCINPGSYFRIVSFVPTA